MEGPQEGVLADVLGLVGSHHASGDAEDDIRVALHELAESAQVAAAGPVDEITIRVVHAGSITP